MAHYRVTVEATITYPDGTVENLGVLGESIVDAEEANDNPDAED